MGQENIVHSFLSAFSISVYKMCGVLELINFIKDSSLFLMWVVLVFFFSLEN